PAGGRRAAGRLGGDRRRAARVPRSRLRQVVAAGPLRVHRRDPEDERRQVPEDGAPPDVRQGRSRDIVIKTIWLDNPPVNAVNAAIIDTIWTELESLDDEVRVVVLRGKGDRAFSAGADIAGFVGGGSDGERPVGIQPAANLIESVDVPV